MMDNKKKINSTQKVFFILTAILFIASLTQNTYNLEKHPESIGSLGLLAFLLGWGFMISAKVIPWLANPLVAVSWILRIAGQNKKAKLLGSLAVLCGLFFLTIDTLPIHEGGTEGKVIGYDVGYWLWMGSLFINAIGFFISDYIHSEE